MTTPWKSCVIYTAIPGFPAYMAGSNGDIVSMNKKTKVLKPDRRKEDGRARYTLRHESGKYVKRYGSYFVLLAFVGDRPDGMEACHQDGNCLNDSAGNLRWDTSTANKADMVRHNTRRHGEQIHTAKLTEDDVRAIRQRSLAGETSTSIASDYPVSVAMISLIVRKKSWQHVK